MEGEPVARALPKNKARRTKRVSLWVSISKFTEVKSQGKSSPKFLYFGNENRLVNIQVFTLDRLLVAIAFPMPVAVEAELKSAIP